MLEKISFAQFAKMYRSAKNQDKESEGLVDDDENLAAAEPEEQDCHSLAQDWAGPPEYSPPASLSPDPEFLSEPEPDPATIARHKVEEND